MPPDCKENDAPALPLKRPRKVTARQYPRFVQRQIALSLAEICEGLLSRAKKGDVKCIKLLWQMAELDSELEKTTGGRAVDSGLAFARKVLAEFQGEVKTGKRAREESART